MPRSPCPHHDPRRIGEGTRKYPGAYLEIDFVLPAVGVRVTWLSPFRIPGRAGVPEKTAGRPAHADARRTQSADLYAMTGNCCGKRPRERRIKAVTSRTELKPATGGKRLFEHEKPHCDDSTFTHGRFFPAPMLIGDFQKEGELAGLALVATGVRTYRSVVPSSLLSVAGFSFVYQAHDSDTRPRFRSVASGTVICAAERFTWGAGAPNQQFASSMSGFVA